MPEKKCFYCGESGDVTALRPYGPNNNPICFPCMKASPDRESEATRNYKRLLEKAEAESSVILLTDNGPRPAF